MVATTWRKTRIHSLPHTHTDAFRKIDGNGNLRIDSFSIAFRSFQESTSSDKRKRCLQQCHPHSQLLVFFCRLFCVCQATMWTIDINYSSSMTGMFCHSFYLSLSSSFFKDILFHRQVEFICFFKKPKILQFEFRSLFSIHLQ